MDEQAVALPGQLLVDANQGFRRRPLQKRLGRRVKGRAQEIVGGRVANVELDRGIERSHIDEVRLAEVALFIRRSRGQGLALQILERTQRLDAESGAVLAIDGAAFEDHAGGIHLGRAACRITFEDQLFAFVKAVIGKFEDILGNLLERVVAEPFDERPQLPVLFQDVEDVMVPAVLADQPRPAGGGRLRPGYRCALVSRGTEGELVILRLHLDAVRGRAVDHQRVAEAAQFQAELSTRRVEEDLPIALDQVHVLAVGGVAAGQAAGDLRRDGRRLVDFGRRLAAANRQHLGQGHVGNVIGDRVDKVLGSNHGHA